MNGAERRRPAVELEDVATAFENRFPDLSYYLDLETGAVAMVSDETRHELEAIYAELDTGEDLDDVAVDAALRQRDMPDWQRETLEEADRVERGFETRYVAIPRDDAHDAYHDMEDFILTVTDRRLQDRLSDAVDGRGASSRRWGTGIAGRAIR